MQDKQPNAQEAYRSGISFPIVVITMLSRTDKNTGAEVKVRRNIKWAASWQNQQTECAPSEP